MIADLGHIFLAIGCLSSLAQAVCSFCGAAKGNVALIKIGRMSAFIQLAGFASALGALIYAYVISDFSLVNVALNSHTDKPLLYKISGVWGNHEGSMLLWLLILSLFGAFAALPKKGFPQEFLARALGVQALLGFGFALYELLASDPFVALDQSLPNGRGLNPILQDPGLALHPPLLYLGYVGFSMPFSYAVASLIEGRLDSLWLAASRRGLRVAWTFLTFGVVTGALWAYATLGWGGWWGWDPVENASLMPWLAATALLHIAFVVDKRDKMKAWAIFLAILTFSLSLMGTFLVRSGSLSSVHSFATDPTRGILVLALLFLATGGALALFALRAPALAASAGCGTFEALSREIMMLIASLALVLALGNVALGTLYPLAIEALDLGKVTVGPSYFNAVFVLPIFAMAVIMGPGAMLAWGRGGAQEIFAKFRFASVVGVAVALGIWCVVGTRGGVTALAMGLAAWLFAGCLTDALERLQAGRVPLLQSLRRIFQMSRTRVALLLAHGGLSAMIAGVAASSAWSVDAVQRMYVGDTATLAGYSVTLKRVEKDLIGPNFIFTRGEFEVSPESNNHPVIQLAPELRQYDAPSMALAHPAIKIQWFSNLYLVISGVDDSKEGGNDRAIKNQSYIVHLYDQPLMSLIFVGGLMMAAGGIVSATRRSLKKEKLCAKMPVHDLAETKDFDH